MSLSSELMYIFNAILIKIQTEFFVKIFKKMQRPKNAIFTHNKTRILYTSRYQDLGIDASINQEANGLEKISETTNIYVVTCFMTKVTL